MEKKQAMEERDRHMITRGKQYLEAWEDLTGLKIYFFHSSHIWSSVRELCGNVNIFLILFPDESISYFNTPILTFPQQDLVFWAVTDKIH